MKMNFIEKLFFRRPVPRRGLASKGRISALLLAVGLVMGMALSGCSTRRTRGAESEYVAEKITRADKRRKNAAQKEAMDDILRFNTGEKEEDIKKRKDPVLAAGYILNISILVAGEKEIDEEDIRIQNDGTVVLPLVGSVKAKGKTLAEFRTHLYALYNESFFVKPQVIVAFVLKPGDGSASPWGFVTVLGRVKKPGRVNIPATGNLRLTRAIQQVGGFSSSAKDTAILVTRVGKDGKTKKIEINLRSIGAKGKKDDDIILYSGDIIFVPELIF